MNPFQSIYTVLITAGGTGATTWNVRFKLYYPNCLPIARASVLIFWLKQVPVNITRNGRIRPLRSDTLAGTEPGCH
jgi:hypothetical protein